MDGLGAVIGQQFCSPDEIHLTIMRKVVAITGGNFVVTDDKGNVMFNVKEKLLSVHGSHVLADAQGNMVVAFKKKILSAHRRWQVFKGDSSDPDDLLFSVMKTSLIQFNTELDVILGSNKEENTWDFKVEGSWLERSCVIYNSNSTAIAQMQKLHTFGSIVIGKDTFSVIVYPNVDSAFMVALVVILHEINEEKAN